MTTPWYLNGRAEENGPGGFARFHHEVAARLTARDHVSVIKPPAGRSGPIGSRFWERRTLPKHSDDGLLLSTTNNGPVRHPRHAVVIHDILPLTHPHTVSAIYAQFQQLVLPPLCRSATAVITVSENVADQLVDRLGVARDRVTVARPGVSTVFHQQPKDDDRSRFGVDNDRALVVALVSSIPRKNSRETLLALATLAAAHQDVQVIVAGHDGPVRVFGRNATRPTHPSVLDLGPVDDETLAALYRAADVFVSLSEAEGFGLPPMEALACGACVVSTPVPSVVELGGDAVRVVDDHHAAVGEVLDLLAVRTDPDARRANQDAARAAVASLTWENTAMTIADVLCRMESNDH